MGAVMKLFGVEVEVGDIAVLRCGGRVVIDAIIDGDVFPIRVERNVFFADGSFSTSWKTPFDIVAIEKKPKPKKHKVLVAVCKNSKGRYYSSSSRGEVGSTLYLTDGKDTIIAIKEITITEGEGLGFSTPGGGGGGAAGGSTNSNPGTGTGGDSSGEITWVKK